MCESHITRQLCGHEKIKILVKCADMIDGILASNLSGDPEGFVQPCDDSIERFYVFPDICDKCKVFGVVGDWMELPGVKFQVLREWKSTERRAQSLPTHESTHTEEDARIDDLEEMEFLQVPTTSSDPSFSSTETEADAEQMEFLGTPDTRSATESSSLETRNTSLCADPTTSPPTAKSSGQDAEIASLISRADHLTERARQLVLKIRARRASSIP